MTGVLLVLSLIHIYPLEDMDRHPVQTDSDGMVTLYHRTTPEAAAAIMRSGQFSSRENTDETFFSNQRNGPNSNYGNTVVAVRVRPEQTLSLIHI